MTIYILDCGDELAAFVSLAEAMAYPFETGFVPPDAPGAWSETRQQREGRMWVLAFEGVLYTITAHPLIGFQEYVEKLTAA